MKKRFIFWILLIAAACLFLSVGCKPPKKETLTIAFQTGTSETLSERTVDLSKADELSLPSPSREVFLAESENRDGWYFDGWYFDRACQAAYSPDLLREKSENGKVTLYAKWEIYMQINGKIDGKTVLNPEFAWKNQANDKAFGVLIRDEAGNTVLRDDVSENFYQLPINLAYGKKYTFIVSGKTSNVTFTCPFETIAGEGKPDYRSAEFSVSEPFKSHMVLQRGKPIEIKGKAPAKALVIADFYGTQYLQTASDAGEFSFAFPAMEANATPTDLSFRILKEKKIVLEDVLVGDVYLVSGQSNVQWCLKDSDYTEADVDNAVRNDVRFYSMSTSRAEEPIDTVKDGKWFKINKLNPGYTWYSAIAFMVGSMLGTELAEAGVPIGVMSASQGDTNIVSWMGKEYYDGPIANKNLHYNAMIHPLRNGNLSGVIWYQGCNNSAKGSDYKALLGKLKQNWRALFRNEDMPFYIVQLPVFDGDSGNNYDFSFVRESQYLSCEEDEDAYLIATCDGGDPTYIHPREKRYICERLTKSILSTVYGKPYLPQSPTYLSHVVQGNRAIVSVKNGEGLNAKGEIVGFELAGADGKYYGATASIEGGKLVVTSESVAAPVYIKYGFSKSPFLNVYNKDGFLLSPFRTDRYNRGIDLLDYKSGANYAQSGGDEMTYEIVSVGNEKGFRVSKAGGSAGYGILKLDKWGAIGYEESAMKIRVVGTNSGATVRFRIRENSYEIWAYSFTDDFTGEKTFTFPLSDLTCVDSPSDGILDTQAVRNIDIAIQADGAATITFLDVKFVDPQG